MTTTKYLCECGATHDVPITTRKRSNIPLFFCPSCASPSYDLCRDCGFQAPAGTHKTAAGAAPYCMGCGKAEGLMVGKYQLNVAVSLRYAIACIAIGIAYIKLTDLYQVPIQHWHIMVATKYIGPGGVWFPWALWGAFGFYLWIFLGRYCVKFVHALLVGHGQLAQPARLLEVWLQAPFASVEPEEEQAVIHIARSLRRRLRTARRYLKLYLKRKGRTAQA